MHAKDDDCLPFHAFPLALRTPDKINATFQAACAFVGGIQAPKHDSVILSGVLSFWLLQVPNKK